MEWRHTADRTEDGEENDGLTQESPWLDNTSDDKQANRSTFLSEVFWQTTSKIHSGGNTILGQIQEHLIEPHCESCEKASGTSSWRIRDIQCLSQKQDRIPLYESIVL
jgi:hypothetical protein